MSPTFAGRALAAVSLVLALASCELFKRNEDALATINARVIGMPTGEFFDRYGRARARSPLADGTTEYDWTSSVGYAKSGPEGLDDHICRLRLASDQRGRISRVQVLYDAPGTRSASRCRELCAGS